MIAKFNLAEKERSRAQLGNARKNVGICQLVGDIPLLPTPSRQGRGSDRMDTH
jgi:hypothetical protein